MIMEREQERVNSSPLHSEKWDPVNHPYHPGANPVEQSLMHQQDIADYISTSIFDVVHDRFGGTIRVSPNEGGDLRRANSEVKKNKMVLESGEEYNVGQMNFRMNINDHYDYDKLDEELVRIT